MAGPGYETRDISIRPLVLGAIGLLGMLVLFFALMWPTFEYFLQVEADRSPARHPLAVREGRRLPAGPRLQSDPRRDLAEMRAREDAILNGYAWNDEGRDSARVPVERAIDMLVEGE